MTETSFVLYRSETDLAPGSDAALELAATARRVNAQFGNTGFLHHEEGFFFQWLEGNPEPMRLICGRIERDPRHFAMTYLLQGTRHSRQFSDWDMGYSTGSLGSILTWLADHSVSPRDKTAFAAAVLEFLQHQSVALA